MLVHSTYLHACYLTCTLCALLFVAAAVHATTYYLLPTYLVATD